jgi:hypothetical protein
MPMLPEGRPEKMARIRWLDFEIDKMARRLALSGEVLATWIRERDELIRAVNPEAARERDE